MLYVKGRSFFKGKMIKPSRKVQFGVGGAKAGAGAGWTINTGVDTDTAHMAASQTAGTLIVPLPPLEIGDTITGYYANAGITSAGGTVTFDMALHKQLNVTSAVPTDSVVGTTGITQISKTAGAIVNVGNSRKSGLSEVVADGASYYLLITGTTGSACDIDLTSLVVELNKNS